MQFMQRGRWGVPESAQHVCYLGRWSAQTRGHMLLLQQQRRSVASPTPTHSPRWSGRGRWWRPSWVRSASYLSHECWCELCY